MVVARLNYIDPTTPSPTTYYVEPPAGVPICSVVDAPREVEIEDARGRASPFSIEADGFSFVRLETRFRDFDDPAAVRERLYPEMEAITRERLGVRLARSFDHAVRRRPPPDARLRGGGVTRQPLHRVHCDFTPRSAREMVAQMLGDEAEEALTRRFAFVNYWRPLSGPLRDDPLAICDPRSVQPDDLVAVRHVHAAGDSEIFGVAHNPAHRWHYMSDMEPDEALFFKVYDSGDERMLVAPHSAFTLPDPPQPVPPRESFEFRLMVFYD